MLYELYPGFLDMGYSPSFFWECSLKEIEDLFEAYARKKERQREVKESEMKDYLVSLQVLAMQIGEALVGNLFPDKAPAFRTVQDFYPNLFGKAESAEDKRLRERNEKMRQYAAEHNARWRKAHGKEVEDGSRNDP